MTSPKDLASSGCASWDRPRTPSVAPAVPTRPIASGIPKPFEGFHNSVCGNVVSIVLQELQLLVDSLDGDKRVGSSLHHQIHPLAGQRRHFVEANGNLGRFDCYLLCPFLLFLLPLLILLLFPLPLPLLIILLFRCVLASLAIWVCVCPSVGWSLGRSETSFLSRVNFTRNLCVTHPSHHLSHHHKGRIVVPTWTCFSSSFSVFFVSLLLSLSLLL